MLLEGSAKSENLAMEARSSEIIDLYRKLIRKDAFWKVWDISESGHGGAELRNHKFYIGS